MPIGPSNAYGRPEPLCNTRMGFPYAELMVMTSTKNNIPLIFWLMILIMLGPQKQSLGQIMENPTTRLAGMCVAFSYQIVASTSQGREAVYPEF